MPRAGRRAAKAGTAGKAVPRAGKRAAKVGTAGKAVPRTGRRTAGILGPRDRRLADSRNYSVGLHITFGVDEVDTQISQDILGNCHGNP